ncbi:hypothetical protein FACS1894139_16510 [Planctomycetales bacterium]|nr:hypothetical protein FACS1894108_16080 [Planctomycetales bacterium]GHT07748.1 hypothetical protein FACS1894139_16510 [Planctomycetales bacterium]
MKKTFLLLFYFAFAGLSVYPQDDDGQSLGSAGKLEGNTYILTCFISDQDNEWQYSEKEDVLRKYNEALAFLKIQASRYNIDVDFEKFSFGISTDIKTRHISASGSGDEDTELISEVLKTIGYEDALSFYDYVMENTDCDNVLVILFSKGLGTGYAMAYTYEEMDEELSFFGRCDII